MQNADVKGKQ